MRWQDESAQAPVGFAMPQSGTIGDIVYHEHDFTAEPGGPAPQINAPDTPVPTLESLAPAPPTPRDPTTAFHTGTDQAAEPAAWDPHQPMTVGGTASKDDDWSPDEHPDFPPPTGRPMAPGRAPAYPAPAGRPVAAAPMAYPNAGHPGTSWHPESGAPMPGVGHIARPTAEATASAPGDPYQAMHQPYPQARPWQADAGTTNPIYRPSPVPPTRPIQLDWITLILLAAGIVIAPLSWLLFVVALIVGGSRHLRPAVTTAFSICSTVIVIVWLVSLIGSAMGNPIFLDASPYVVAARLSCAAVAATMLADFFLARNRGH